MGYRTEESRMSLFLFVVPFNYPQQFLLSLKQGIDPAQWLIGVIWDRRKFYVMKQFPMNLAAILNAILPIDPICHFPNKFAVRLHALDIILQKCCQISGGTG